MATTKNSKTRYSRLLGEPGALQYVARRLKRIYALDDYPSSGRIIYYTARATPLFERVMQTFGIQVSPVLTQDSKDIRRINRAGI